MVPAENELVCRRCGTQLHQKGNFWACDVCKRVVTVVDRRFCSCIECLFGVMVGGILFCDHCNKPIRVKIPD